MNVELLKEALHDRQVSRESTEGARSVAVSARQETQDMLERMDQRVQLHVAAVVGATVELHPKAFMAADDDR